MKCQGMVTELEIDAEEYDFDVTDAIVEHDRISIDWIEDDEPFHAKLNSSDGVEYGGNYGCPKPDSAWTMTATRYDSAGGAILLLAQWYQDDNGRGGTCIFELNPGPGTKPAWKEKRVTLELLTNRVEALERAVAMLRARYARST